MKRIALLGYPLSHSLSPIMQQAALDLAKLDWSYEALPTRPEALEDRIASMRKGGWLGANVTIPLKELVLSLLDGLESEAQQVGAVNTIVNERGRWIGHNTDVSGFLSDLAAHWDASDGGTAWILGAGGAARAVAVGLAGLGLELNLIARSIERGRALASDVERSTGAQIAVHPWQTDSYKQAAGTCDLLVNATPLGMAPSQDATPWPSGIPLPAKGLVYDLICQACETRLVKDARLTGLRAVSGEGMLLEQGALAFERWTGVPAPRGHMRTALHHALEHRHA